VIRSRRPSVFLRLGIFFFFFLQVLPLPGAPCTPGYESVCLFCCGVITSPLLFEAFLETQIASFRLPGKKCHLFIAVEKVSPSSPLQTTRLHALDDQAEGGSPDSNGVAVED